MASKLRLCFCKGHLRCNRNELPNPSLRGFWNRSKLTASLRLQFRIKNYSFWLESRSLDCSLPRAIDFAISKPSPPKPFMKQIDFAICRIALSPSLNCKNKKTTLILNRKILTATSTAHYLLSTCSTFVQNCIQLRFTFELRTRTFKRKVGICRVCQLRDFRYFSDMFALFHSKLTSI